MNPDPYAPPQTADTLAPDPESNFSDLDDKVFNKLYYRSCNVTAITFLLGLGLLVIVGITVADVNDEIFTLPVLIGVGAFYLVALIGLVKRTSWGRILGIIVCILSLINIPIGTAIGIVGLFAFFGAPNFHEKAVNKKLKFTSSNHILRVEGEGFANYSTYPPAPLGDGRGEVPLRGFRGAQWWSS